MQNWGEEHGAEVVVVLVVENVPALLLPDLQCDVIK